MAIANSYPVGTVKTEDLILGTSIPLAGTNDKPVTKNFSVASVLALGSPPNILTATVLVTDAQIRTLGTAPVVILPVVKGYTYQILGLTTQALSSGSIGEFYDFGAQDGLFSWRTTLFTGSHRVEIPNAYLPKGGGVSNAGLYVGTPIAGAFRNTASLLLGVTSNTNPIIVAGEDPNATWKINVTYRLIQTQ
tara:strand:- start:147 stop:722 length:576 start_codon:yes stop_codon:yes gene_type:complete